MYKTNRVNHDFQIAFFIAGACHTPDGAYAQLCDLKEDRDSAIQHAKAGQLRARAKRVRAEALMTNHDEATRLDAQADISELDANIAVFERNYAAALDEVNFIERCMLKLQPLRKYLHLTNAQSHEAAQAEEWKLELIRRAENSILTTGAIPTDQYATMRLHPEFGSSILPAISEIHALLSTQEGQLKLSTRTAARSVEMQQLLGV